MGKAQIDRKEIQVWYQAFLKECPSGTLTRDRFLAYYDNFFPFGDPTAFAGHMFRTYDQLGQGRITFENYLQVLSAVTRGRLEEKVKWAFRLYDQDGDGQVSRADMTVIIDAIYRMVGSSLLSTGMERVSERVEGLEPGEGDEGLNSNDTSPRHRVDKLFKQMGKEAQSALTLEEFSEGIQIDPSAIQCLLLYDGVV